MGISELDAQIAQARAQMRALRELAKTDAIAKLVVSRIDAAQKETLRKLGENLPGSNNCNDQLGKLLRDG